MTAYHPRLNGHESPGVAAEKLRDDMSEIKKSKRNLKHLYRRQDCPTTKVVIYSRKSLRDKRMRV